MVKPFHSKLSLLQEAQATDLLLNSMISESKSFEDSIRRNERTGKQKHSLLLIARNAQARFFRRYQVEIARTGASGVLELSSNKIH